MNVFNYTSFNEQYNILNNIIGIGDTTTSTINGIIAHSNRTITEGLEYAENSTWASAKINEWNELMTKLNTDLANLNTLLQQAAAASSAYKEFEQTNNGPQVY